MYFAKKNCAAVVACAGLASAQFMNPSHGSVIDVGQKIDIKWNQAGLQAPLSISLIPGGTIIEESIIIQQVAVNIGNVGVISWTADESITAIETFSMVIIDAHKTIVVSEPFIINHLHKKPHYKHGHYGHVTTVTVTEKEGHYMTKTETTTVETDMPVMTEKPKTYTSGDYLKYLPGEAQTDYYQHLTPLPGGDYMKTTEENKYYQTSEEMKYDTTSTTMEEHKYTTEEMKYETSTTEEKMYETSTTEEKMYETSTTEVKYTPPYMQTYSAPPPPPETSSCDTSTTEVKYTPPAETTTSCDTSTTEAVYTPPAETTTSCDTSTTEVKYMPPAMNTYVPPPPPPPAYTYTPPEMKTYAPPPPPPAYSYTPPEMKTYAPPPPPPADTYTPPAQTYTPPPMQTYTPPPMDTYTPPPPPPQTYTPPPPPPETSVESIYTPSEVPTTFETSIPVVTPPAITGNATVPGNGTFPITALGIRNVPSGWIVGVSVLLGLMI